MSSIRPLTPLLLLGLVMVNACSRDIPGGSAATPPESELIVAHLGRAGGDGEGLARLRAAFEKRNPGYSVAFEPRLAELETAESPRLIFAQAGESRGTITGVESTVTVGDVILVRPGQTFRADPPFGAVVFTSPEPLPPALPAFIRPDWDEKITDTPGGCAEETGAYRRILLTWLDSVGPYTYHALNAHRVRITDSFTHYHPEDGGFDEFYLVQMVQPTARLITSHAVDTIENPDQVNAEQAEDLLTEHELSVGDLIYLPRGTIHRGVGGVLAQVITVPGFKPGAEIGVDHHLKRINANLGLEGDDRVPLCAKASARAVTK